MDERCPDAVARLNGGARLNERCFTCSHVFAAHGYDGMCDICALERQLRRQMSTSRD